jgi:hypothetical protein
MSVNTGPTDLFAPVYSIRFNSIQFNSIEQAAIDKGGVGWRFVVYLWLAGLIDYYARAAIIIVGCGWTCTLFFLLHRHHGPRLRRGSLRCEQRGPGFIDFYCDYHHPTSAVQ